MASAEQLIQEAEYAFFNISPGSTNEAKYTATAKRLAKRVIARHPTGVEAVQARNILQQLGVRMPRATPRASVLIHNHSSSASHSPHPAPRVRKPASTFKPLSPAQAKAAATAISMRPKGTKSADAPSWADVWQRYSALSYLQKKIVAFALLFLLLIVSFTPVLLFGAVVYFLRPRLAKEHACKILDALG